MMGWRRVVVAVAAGCASMTAGCSATTGDAVEAQAKVVERETSVPNLVARGDTFASVGDMTRAEQYYATALAAGGDHAELVRKIIRVCVADRRYREAIVYAEDYLRKHPDDTAVRFALATLSLAVEDTDAARDALERVLTDSPSDADAHFAMATLLQGGEESDAAGAELHYRRYLELAPRGRSAAAARAALRAGSVGAPRGEVQP
jgi:Tfp pilus assembly protein PilF